MFLGRTIDPARAELIVRLASGVVRAEVRQRIDRVAETVDLLPRGGMVLLLPELPVWAVSDVVEVVNGISTTLTAGTDYREELGPDGRVGILRRLGGRQWPIADIAHPVTAFGPILYGPFGPGSSFGPGGPFGPWGDARVTVTYDHGFDLDDDDYLSDTHVIPDVLEAVVLRVAVRAVTNPAALRQESIEDSAVGKYSWAAAGTGDSLGLYSPPRTSRTLVGFYPGTRTGALPHDYGRERERSDR